MSNDDFMDEARAARIDAQIDEVHRFLLALIDDPTPLSKIPNGSTLRHRTIQLDDQRVQLTAHRQSESDEPWTARVTSWDSQGSLDSDAMSPAATRDRSDTALPSEGRVEEDDELVQTAETADAALDALEHVIRQRPALIARGGYA